MSLRVKTSREVAIIRNGRPLLDRILIRIFPRTFNRFANRHLARAKEVMEISSYTLHNMAHIVGADCRLPGHGDVRESGNAAREPHEGGMYDGIGL